MHVRRSLTTFSGVALLGLLAAAFVACTGQGEGERCDQSRGGEDPSTGPSDCNDGLVCVQANLLGQNADVCCPKDPTQRTGICAGKATTSGGDTGTTEAASETSSDASDAADAADTADATDANDAADATDANDAAETATSDAADANEAG